jgi:hypothetical protein
LDAPGSSSSGPGRARQARRDGGVVRLVTVERSTVPICIQLPWPELDDWGSSGMSYCRFWIILGAELG